ncbi:two-component sensor histidine kinase [Paenibacillus sp. CCS19]|uniref:sensor histidine kinase n=1 Tax=Paenibacillus sp. CCS19 TaxID=3158387 RepID=UPI002560DF17|nr:HAMP domain-containing sensor histidine kinase [Paenibacillus cellulosilyticus]GMK39757.1 two-component sensor histidine kinase [Paenibacillus cellulosilyticus]
MNGSFTRIITGYVALFTLACGAFATFLFYEKPSREVWQSAIAFVLVVAALFAGYLLGIRNRMATILDKLSLMIQSLINGQALNEFAVSEDSVLSKLQDQTLKLHNILKMQKLKYKEEGEEIKSLISDITHQLRTPLSNLNMYNGLLLDDKLSPEKRMEFARIMKDQTEKLTWLMDSLVKMSRLEIGIIEIRSERRDIVDTVLTAIKQAFPAARSKGVEIAFHGKQSIELLHDAKWVGEAISNVLDNAIKYTASGGKVKVVIERYEMFARIDVSDNGRGIPESEINKVFQRFYRGAASRDTQGVGIGLYLTRKIVAEQGGYMKASSEEGKGSTFSIFMPLDASGPMA